MRQGSAPALLLSLLLHAAALGALFFFLREAGEPHGADREHAMLAVPAWSDPEAVPAVEDLRPVPEVAGEALAPPQPSWPVLPPREPARGEKAVELLPIERSRIRAEGWRRETLPLAVARRRIRLLSPAPAPVPPPPRRSSTPGLRPPPLVLEPVRTPIFYPREADRRRLEGVVIVAFTVHTSGVVIDARVRVSSGHALLDAAALASVRQWRFLPIPRNQRAEKPFRFKARR